ncbi:hypothetical protein EV121DRAFT_296860 [Schizophyllum commune]
MVFLQARSCALGALEAKAALATAMERADEQMPTIAALRTWHQRDTTLSGMPAGESTYVNDVARADAAAVLLGDQALVDSLAHADDPAREYIPTPGWRCFVAKRDVFGAMGSDVLILDVALEALNVPKDLDSMRLRKMAAR